MNSIQTHADMMYSIHHQAIIYRHKESPSHTLNQFSSHQTACESKILLDGDGLQLEEWLHGCTDHSNV